MRKDKDMAEVIDYALRMAAWEDGPETLKALIGAGADVHVGTDAPMWGAAFSGRIDNIRALLDAGADQDIALLEAAENGLTEMVGELLGRGADAEMCDGLPLQMAAIGGHTETVKAMLAAGADFYSDCALFIAAGHGHTDTVRALLEAGVLGHAAARREAEKNGHGQTARFLKNWRSSKRKKHASAS